MITLNPENCNGCKTCTKICPHAVLEIRNHKVFLAAKEHCIECGACQLNCHDEAIEVTKGTGCLLSIIRDDILKIKPGKEMSQGKERHPIADKKTIIARRKKFEQKC